MSIARWDPFSELSALQQRMNRLLRDATQDREQEGDSPFTTAGFVPPIDVSEDDNNLTIEMEIPGINEKDLNIRVDGNVLTVSGERKLEREEKGKDFRRVERQYGRFQRSLTLPASVDTGSAEANYDNGVLRIRFNKRAEAKSRQIQIGEKKPTVSGERDKSKAA